MTEQVFDYGAELDELRCHTTEWLAAARDDAVREQRRWRMRELAITRVLDERGRVDDSWAEADGVSVRSVHSTVATARRLEDLPEIAAVAAAGGLSDAQLSEVVKVAEPGDDREWAQRAPSWSARDLATEARRRHTPTAEEGAARRAARELRWWWRQDRGMLDGRFSLPDVDGALFEAVLHHLVEQKRPAKGQPWERRERRAADALMDLVRAASTGSQDHEPSAAPSARLIVQVPVSGPATVAGVPLPDSVVERLRAQAGIEPVLVDTDGEPVVVGRVFAVLSDKTKRVVRQRDGTCRWPGCEHRHHLEVHHLWPASWGGPDHLHNLAAICTQHHAVLVPQGRWLLLGNPSTPDGLSLVDRDDLPTLARLAAEHTRTRAGPEAA